MSELGENALGLDGEPRATPNGKPRPRSRTPAILQATFVVAALTIIGRMLGLAKDLLLAGILGASASYDTLLAALYVPMLFFSFVRIPLRACFIPFFSEQLDNDGEESAWDLANVFNSSMILVFLAVAALCMAFSPTLTWMIVPGFENIQHETVARLMRYGSWRRK